MINIEETAIKPKKEKIIHPAPIYCRGEELINVVTHAVGAAIGVIALVVMVTLAAIYGDVSKIIGSVVFGLGLIWLYTMSTLYHNEVDPEKRRIGQKFDHLSINILIASSFTFFSIGAMKSTLGYILTAVVWGLSIMAMIFSSINVKKYRAITMVVYIVTGWMPIFIIHILYGLLGVGGIVWLIAGGLFYTFGLIFYAIHKPYMHAIWHFFVLGGSICHIICGIFYVLI